MSTLARRLPAVRPLRLPAWLRHGLWFGCWLAAGFAGTLAIIGL